MDEMRAALLNLIVAVGDGGREKQSLRVETGLKCIEFGFRHFNGDGKVLYTEGNGLPGYEVTPEQGVLMLFGYH